jgi:glyceraldehyde 3-phosphate dehydrogenase
MSIEKEDQLLQDYIQRLELSEQMLPIIGRLYRNQGVLMRVYGRAINNVTTVDILKTHR